MKDPYSIVKRPIISEKGMYLANERRAYAFEVDRKANKCEIRQAIEKIFSVKVKAVNTMNMKGRTANAQFKRAAHKSWKKAVVTLEGDYTIELF